MHKGTGIFRIHVSNDNISGFSINLGESSSSIDYANGELAFENELKIFNAGLNSKISLAKEGVDLGLGASYYQNNNKNMVLIGVGLSPDIDKGIIKLSKSHGRTKIADKMETTLTYEEGVHLFNKTEVIVTATVIVVVVSAPYAAGAASAIAPEALAYAAALSAKTGLPIQILRQTPVYVK